MAVYLIVYPSPVGDLTLVSNGEALTGLWMAGQKYFASGIREPFVDGGNLPLLQEASAWLDVYFGGHAPKAIPFPLLPAGSEFQRRVWQALMQIPYGQTATYGQIACALGMKKTAARAVGAAIGRNPIAIFIPCHRVLSAAGDLTGFAGGIERKLWLMQHEQSAGASGL